MRAIPRVFLLAVLAVLLSATAASAPARSPTSPQSIRPPPPIVPRDPRFSGVALGDSPTGNGKVAKHHFVVGDGYVVRLRDRTRGRTPYRLCLVRGNRRVGCSTGRTGAKGRRGSFGTKFVAPQDTGRFVYRWFVGGRNVAQWRVSIGAGDGGPSPSVTDAQDGVTVDFRECARGAERIWVEQGSTTLALRGKSGGRCRLDYGGEVEEPNWDGKLDHHCRVPVGVRTLTFPKRQFGVDLSQIRRFCHT